VYQTVGMAGYYVGPDRHIIDTLALCDPLLARLPAIPPWRIGHYQRAIPEGYFESVDTDTNLVRDPEIAALYDRIRLATRAPLWTRERWRAIWRSERRVWAYAGMRV
jgi:arabinofuranosyltransferase